MKGFWKDFCAVAASFVTLHSASAEVPASVTPERVQGTAELLFSGLGALDGHALQGFDIYDGVAFLCYDGGSCVTYDVETGRQIAAFPLGSNYSTNHCGNANFGEEYPEGNSLFPALYVSGDLTTKACYVESVTKTGAELVQTIWFDIEPSYTGGQVIYDHERHLLVYMQRLNKDIHDEGNTFMMYEFRIPALSEGSEVRFTNNDILVQYQLPFYSPLYQGASVVDGILYQTHGDQENAFGSRVGVMCFDAQTHEFTRHIDLSEAVPKEPQGATVYNGSLIMNFAGGEVYQISYPSGNQ